MLLRLEPGPAEHLFGITSAPRAVVADWHGRVTAPDLNLRGDIDDACGRLAAAYREFDFEKAARPPYAVPDWAGRLVRPGSAKAMLTYLKDAHTAARGGRADGKAMERLADVYRSLDREGDLLAFCGNYLSACQERAPRYGSDYAGYHEEVALLAEMTYCRNDKVKFDALDCYGRFAPVGGIGFFVERAANRTRDSLNPNVVLCRCVDGIGIAASRFPGVKDPQSARDRTEIVKTLPLLANILDTEGRNNGACSGALKTITAIAERTGAPEALEAYLHVFNPPTPGNPWLEEYTAKFLDRNRGWIVEQTGEDHGNDYAAWQRWFGQNEKNLFFVASSGRFVIDARAASAFRRKLQRS